VEVSAYAAACAKVNRIEARQAELEYHAIAAKMDRRFGPTGRSR
jgi:hypothetical protein